MPPSLRVQNEKIVQVVSVTVAFGMHVEPADTIDPKNGGIRRATGNCADQSSAGPRRTGRAATTRARTACRLLQRVGNAHDLPLTYGATQFGEVVGAVVMGGRDEQPRLLRFAPERLWQRIVDFGQAAVAAWARSASPQACTMREPTSKAEFGRVEEQRRYACNAGDSRPASPSIGTPERPRSRMSRYSVRSEIPETAREPRAGSQALCCAGVPQGGKGDRRGA